MTTLIDAYNYLRVDSALSTSGQPSEDQLRSAATSGYAVIINLALHDDPRYSLADEAGLVAGLGMEYVHIPVQFDAPTEADLVRFFHHMDRCAGKTIHIHCAANFRVTAFLGLYGMIRKRQSEDEAFAPMRQIWVPDEVWASFIAVMLVKHAGESALSRL